MRTKVMELCKHDILKSDCAECKGEWVAPEEKPLNLKRARPDWDTYFMGIAVEVAARGSCDRLLVGALLVLDNRILVTGYNGAPTGWPSCDEEGHELVRIGDRESCQRTIHAEENALLQCAMNGIRAEGATLYTTASTCYDCFKRVAQVKVRRIVYGRAYTSARNGAVDIAALAARVGIELVHNPGH